MYVNVNVTKLVDGRIGVTVSWPQWHLKLTQEYDSEEETCEVLRHMGVPKEALDFYF